MKGFQIKTEQNQIIRFRYYSNDAPETQEAFSGVLPFSRDFLHARISGQEIWIDNAPKLNIPQENNSVFAQPGEVVIGPKNPERNQIAGCMGIFYGEGKLLDSGNIFGKVLDEDLPKLQQLGDEIWKNGSQNLTFESW